MFDWLREAVSEGAIGYLVVLVAAGADVLVPIVPSETIVITAGVLAAGGDLSIWLLVPTAALGAMIGDNICFYLGRRFGDRLTRRLFRGQKGKERLVSARSAIAHHGAVFVIVGRFIPGGRTASTFAAGTLAMSWPRFFVADAAACLLWALYSALLGYAGGRTFEDSTWKPLAFSFGIAALVGAGIEVARRMRKSSAV